MDYPALTPEQLGQILKRSRQQQGLTQQQTGSKVGIRQSVLSRMEADMSRCSVGGLYKLLSALQLELVLRETSAPAKSSADPVEW